jgi:hypothetical protein
MIDLLQHQQQQQLLYAQQMYAQQMMMFYGGQQQYGGQQPYGGQQYGGQQPYGQQYGQPQPSAPVNDEESRAAQEIATKLSEYESRKGSLDSDPKAGVAYLEKLLAELKRASTYNSATLDMFPDETKQEIEAQLEQLRRKAQQ